MRAQETAKQRACRMLLCLMLAVALPPAFGQASRDAQSLQKSGIAKIDKWDDYRRRTGDAKSTASDLAAAQVDLRTSYDLFLEQKDYAAASVSTFKIAIIQRLLNQHRQAIQAYQSAINLAKLGHRTDYQTTALSNLSYSELRVGEIDAAEEHAREAVRLGTNCGNKNFYFEALDIAGEIEIERGNLMAAGDYLNRALAMSGQIDDKKKLYRAYFDRGDMYKQNATKCDYHRNFEVCYQSLDLARSDYQKALSISQELGYKFDSQLFQKLLKMLDEQNAMLQLSQRGDQTFTNARIFNPQKPKDVGVTEQFAADAMDVATFQAIESAVKELRAWRTRLQPRGITVQNPSDFCLEGDYEAMKGNNDDALAAYRQAHDLLEKDRRDLRNEQERAALMEGKVDCYFHPALLLLDRKEYTKAFAIFERSRSRTMADLLARRPLTFASKREQTLFSERQTLIADIAAKQQKLFNLTGTENRDQNATQIVELQGKITNLQTQFEQLEDRIAKEAPKLKALTTTQPTALASVQRSAAEGIMTLSTTS
jgi:hypothetical protein